MKKLISPFLTFLLFAFLLVSCSATKKAVNPALNSKLLLAIQNKNEAGVEKLLNEGADPDARDNYNRTALMRAVGKGKLVTVKMLLKSGADVNASDDMDKTALSRAMGIGNEAMIKLLKDYGAKE